MTRAPPPGPAFALVLFCLALPCGRHLESGETRECQLGYPLRSEFSTVMDSKQSRSTVQDRSRQITGWMCCYPKLLHVWGGCNARSALIYRTRLHGQTCISLPAEPPNQSTLLNGVTPSLSDQPPRRIFKPGSLQCIMCITRHMQMRRGSSKIKPRTPNLSVRHCVLSSVIGLLIMQRLRSPPSQQQKGGHPVRSIASHMERRQMRNHQMGSFFYSC
ncbi:hypothetical protein FOCG_04770 [Fusarium oxysporum f. sp. radicis-lycopersici 26381]|nr:hypothetical protein FOCG_04770 [Fusarium oxysporum f. sp. radicis-lycopersici 26381]EXL57668.1 hypothetical protein FOCG_04770 [Fusarium oxysporum f. sp. radicis-lycopersici 26381]EXL57669.1 hypothetical protein FOCG_04770 [Fusarium oxysporum f. sp. radicis-lycopersici 26381]EXL57670.1 hypothetical protein FOCG_04770 [Fusarium oxysporum f. sp. radicis-lycopersici 26381]